MLYPVKRLNDICSWNPELAERMWQASSDAFDKFFNGKKEIEYECKQNKDTGEFVCPVCGDLVVLRDKRTFALCSICDYLLRTSLIGGDARDL